MDTDSEPPVLIELDVLEEAGSEVVAELEPEPKPDIAAKSEPKPKTIVDEPGSEPKIEEPLIETSADLPAELVMESVPSTPAAWVADLLTGDNHMRSVYSKCEAFRHIILQSLHLLSSRKSYMDSELAPEFIYDQGLYYPATGYYCGYAYTGMKPPCEWDDHHKFLGLDGQDLQFSTLQTENLPCVYYTPGYDYTQSLYNPFNPYIPGAVIGTDGPYIGTQPCFTNSSYLQTVSSPGYIPVISEPGSDTLLNGSPDPLLYGSGAVKYAPPLSSMSVTTTPLKVSFENLSLEPSHSSQRIQMAGRLSEGAGVSAGPRKKFSPYEDMTGGSIPQMTQITEHSSHGGVPSVRNPLKASFPTNSGFINPGSNVHGWAPGDRTRPRILYSGIPNRILGEQNMGPRINKPKTPLTSPIALKAYATKAGTGDLDGNIIVHADQYNQDDFPVDYPDAKFFVIKSYSEDDVHKSIKYNVWSSTICGNKKLDIAYEEAQRSSVGKPRKCPVFLLFSVNASGHFCGVAEMIGPVDFHKDMDFWLQDKWTGSFPVKWHIIKDLPNSSFRHIILVNNEYRPVTSSRDTQEVPYLPGMNMLTIFKNCPLKTSILDDFMHYEERQQILQEEKSVLLGRKICETAVSPSPFVPVIKPIAAINQPPKADEQQQNGATIQPPVANGKETNAKPDPRFESDGKRSVCQTVDKQKDVESSRTTPGHEGHEGKLDGAANQPSKSAAQAESDGRQTNHRVKQTLETKSNHAKDHSMPKNSTDGLGPIDTHASSRHAAMDSQGKREGKPKSVGCSNGQIGSVSSASSKIDETEFLTVGSVEIELTDTNRSISGTLTIGSI